MNARHTSGFYSSSFQHQLTELNRWRFTPRTCSSTYETELDEMLPIVRGELQFLHHERRAVIALVADLPSDPDAFVEWFSSLAEWGPGQNDPLFPWLANEATLPEVKWFLCQEVAGEAGFEDLTAVTQVRFEGRPKLEMAANYWDEMGRGNAKGMHGPMLQHLTEALGLNPHTETTVWQSLALANTMCGMAAHRPYAYHSVGALGAIELTAPGRAALVDKGLKRLGISAGDRSYFTLHSVLDVKHSKRWNEDVIRPLAGEGDVRRALAEGALMRLLCGERCFKSYRRQLWSTEDRLSSVSARRGGELLETRRWRPAQAGQRRHADPPSP